MEGKKTVTVFLYSTFESFWAGIWLRVGSGKTQKSKKNDEKSGGGGFLGKEKVRNVHKKAKKSIFWRLRGVSGQKKMGHHAQKSQNSASF